jgi:hypothetical protein
MGGSQAWSSRRAWFSGIDTSIRPAQAASVTATIEANKRISLMICPVMVWHAQGQAGAAHTKLRSID